MSKIKVAIIGCSCIADMAHAPGYYACPDVEIKYFCDTVLERAEKLSDRFGGGKVICDYMEAILDPEVDAISICTPNFLHSIIAVEALRHGKHVLCEKPAARTLSEVYEMKRAKDETGKVLSIALCCRYNPCVNEVKKIIESGVLGEIYHVFINFRSHRSIPGLGGAFTMKSKAGGGVLIDWGVHRIDQVMYILGNPAVKSVTGDTYSLLGRDIKNYKYRFMWSEETKNENGIYDVEEAVSAIIRCDGTVINLEGAWAQNIEDRDDYIDFLGTDAGIRLYYNEKYVLYGVRDGEFFTEEHPFEGNPMYEIEMAAFIDCIKSGKPDRADIDNVIPTAEIMEAIYKSADEGREIVLN